MSRAFVLSGGGAAGAWQVGQLRALLEAGVRPDLVVGTSVGAINAAVIAEDPSLEGADRLARIWTRTRRSDLLPPWGWGRLGALSKRALYSSHGLRRLIERNLSYRLIEEAAIPLKVVTTSLETGEARVLTTGPVVEALLASAAIPGIYPSVRIGGERLVDGGITGNVPVAPAVEAGAEEIFVLAASSRCPPPAPVERLQDVLLFSASLLLRPSTDNLAACFASSARVTVLPSSCPFPVGPFDLSLTSRLIDEAREQTASFLEGEQRAA